MEVVVVEVVVEEERVMEVKVVMVVMAEELVEKAVIMVEEIQGEVDLDMGWLVVNKEEVEEDVAMH